jgi:1,4-alpha-glucan branching enzyme
MKKNRTTKMNGSGSPVRKVQVEFVHQTATKVCIAGAFNDWRPEASPMFYLGDGRWGKELALPPGVYEYRLVVDGEWMPDPRAGETAPNPFGGVNSVLKTEEMRELTLWAKALRKRIPAHLCL